jgi:integrase
VLAIHRQLRPLLEAIGPGPANHLVFQGKRRKRAAKADPTSDRVVGVRKPLLRALAAAGIDRHITIHDLRHTFATLCVQAGVDVRQLQEMLGHSTIAMTARYVHALGGYSSAVERIELPT